MENYTGTWSHYFEEGSNAIPDQVLIDGASAEPVRRVSGPVESLPSCNEEIHCCAHGAGPDFPCCRCGSTFRRAR